MNTQTSAKKSPWRFPVSAWIAAIFTVFASLPLAAADYSYAPSTPAPIGYYKIVRSSDPMFPSDANKEYFLDFGHAIERGRTSGTVAVSLRENPRVQVKLLVWQLFPETSTLVIGAPEDENSRQAVALASWKVRTGAAGMILHRDQFQIALQRAQSTD